MLIPELDLRLYDFEPAGHQAEEAFLHAISLNQDMLVPLAEYHSPSGGETASTSCTTARSPEGIPGQPQLVALHLQRGLVEQTFRFEHAPLPLPSMAQSWLVPRVTWEQTRR
ncbi:hypothetical protein [Streptomyces lunaelactis]|uniref:hypothetical protein n=1 Tax=Streptomyces lunaelactis TaxID=1535768 RepID=UPI001585941C|nr:hypothetical protein [Streptomyces lunaelactis]NUK22472.1 hypothetical protein [Streptomyces lunaelactis]